MANGTVPYRMPDGRMGLDFDTSATLDATQNGVVINVVADALTITLPATVVGTSYTIRNGGVKVAGLPVGAVSDQSNLVTVAPNASDQFIGNKFTAADNKAALNTKATSRVGDEIKINGDGVNGWMFVNVLGVWARAA